MAHGEWRCAMRTVWMATLSATLAWGAAQAAPVAMKNAAYAGTFVRDCRTDAAIAAGSTVPDKCETTFAGYDPDGLPIYTNFGRLKEIREQFTLGGFVAQTQTSEAIATVGGEATRSRIDASGEAGTLVLKQGVFTGEYARASGHSLGLQSFYYDGTGDAVRSIENIFDFTSNVTPSTDLNTPGAGGLWTDPVVWAKTRVTVFSLNVADLLFDPFAGFNVQYGGFWEQAQLSSYGDFRLEGEVRNEGITASGTPTYLNFTMEAGRFYFVESYLGLWGRFGGVLDGTHTFTSQLGKTDPDTGGFVATTEGLTAARPSDLPIRITDGELTVPEPSALGLTALALGALVWRRRARH